MKIKIILLINFFLCFACKNNVTQNIDTESEPEIIAEEYLIPFTCRRNTIFVEGVFKDSVYFFILDNGYVMTSLFQNVFTRYYDVNTLNISTLESGYKWQICTVPTQIKLNNYAFLLDRFNVIDASSNTRGGFIGVELFNRHIIELNFEDSLIIIKNKLPENIDEYMSFDLLHFENYEFPTDSLFRQIEISGFYDHAGTLFTGRFFIDLGTPVVTFFKPISARTDFALSKQNTNT
jgi:hypothetical protein